MSILVNFTFSENTIVVINIPVNKKLKKFSITLPPDLYLYLKLFSPHICKASLNNCIKRQKLKQLLLIHKLHPSFPP